MKIAFLGWGSLIWDPRNLRTKGGWQSDGPQLPIEFMRYSGGGRITLVIHPGAEEAQTLWIMADFDDVDGAVENLRAREETITERIGFVTIPDCTSRCHAEPGMLELVQDWAEKKGLDAVVWTDLRDNPKHFHEETGMEMTEDNIVKHLGSLEGEKMEKAKEYVQKAPNQIDTKLRRRIQRELNW